MSRHIFAIIFALTALLGFQGCLNAKTPVKYYTAKQAARYPHDITSYTQGLFFHGGKMYESTGQYGESSFRQVDIRTGNAVRRIDFARQYFVEGSVALDGRLYILTWTNGVCFVYDMESLEYLGQYYLGRQGWGLTTDGSQLIASDGSSKIFFIDPSGFSVKRSVDVKLNGKAVDFINELEYIDGKIWANVYLTENILIINPEDGNVEGVVDCGSLYPKSQRSSRDDVFNGIAYDPSDGSVYVTGKYWKYLYKIEIQENK